MIDAMATVNDTLADLFFASGTDVKFLKQSTTANEFTTITTITTGWFFEWSTFRKQFGLDVAKDDAEFNAYAIQATHIRVGSDDVFVIVAADTTAPTSTDFSWKFYCERFAKSGQFENLY